MTTLPSLFLGHGAPDLPLSDHPAKRHLEGLAAQLPRPRAILVISAHWEAAVPTLGTTPAPDTVYDFTGFSRELYAMRYPARTDARLVAEVEDLLASAGIPYAKDPQRGYDHGAWVPLILSYPNADVPVVQLSLEHRAPAERHLAVGAALAPLRARGVLIIGSGATVHNLMTITREGTAPPPWATGFDALVHDAVIKGDLRTLQACPSSPAIGRQAHPTPEHYWPLLVAMGAGSPGTGGRRIHHSFSYGSISMACFAFGSAEDVRFARHQH